MQTYRPVVDRPEDDARIIRVVRDYLTRDPHTLQRRVGTWGDATFPREDPFLTLGGLMAHLSDELEELDLSLKGYAEDDDEPARKDVAEEAADCLILLFQIAHTVGFDLLAATEDKLVVNMSRTWCEPDERGVVRHVEGE